MLQQLYSISAALPRSTACRSSKSAHLPPLHPTVSDVLIKLASMQVWPVIHGQLMQRGLKSIPPQEVRHPVSQPISELWSLSRPTVLQLLSPCLCVAPHPHASSCPHSLRACAANMLPDSSTVLACAVRRQLLGSRAVWATMQAHAMLKKGKAVMVNVLTCCLAICAGLRHGEEGQGGDGGCAGGLELRQ